MATPLGNRGSLGYLGGLLAASAALLPAQSNLMEWGDRRVDTRLGTLTDFTTIACGQQHSLACRSDGSVVAWGANHDGQCLVPGLTSAVDVAGGNSFSLALLADGTIAAWGRDRYSELQVPALPVGVTYTAMAAGIAHALALRSDGQIVVWGNDYGLGPTVPQLMAVPALPAGTTYTAITTAYYDAAAIRSDGQLLVWGANALGLQNVPTLAPGRSFVAIDMDQNGGASHALALVDDGTVRAWGDNTFDQCNVPSLPAGVRFTQVAAGYSHSAAILSTGDAIVWGGVYPLEPVPSLPTGVVYEQIDCGMSHVTARRSDGRIVTWGMAGPVALTDFGAKLKPFPTTDVSYVDQDCFSNHVLAVRSNGRVVAWGGGSSGQAVAPPGSDFVAVAAGYWSSYALRSNGRILAWGELSLGAGAVPPLPPGVTYTAIDAAGGPISEWAYALRSDGNAVFWGTPRTTLTIPQLPPGLTYVKADAASHTLLRSDGELVPVSSRGGRPSPTHRYVDLSGDSLGTIALRRDGTIAGLPNSTVPPLPPGVHYVEVVMRMFRRAARRSDGRIVTWESRIFPNPDTQDHVPELPAGASYIDLTAGHRTMIARYGPTSTYTTFGNGCAAGAPVTELIPADTPRIGEPLAVRLNNLPLDVAILMTGWQRTTVADSLAAAAATVFGSSCRLHVLPASSTLVAGSGGWATQSATVPLVPELVGRTLHHQAIVLDPAASNPIGAVLSNAATFVIGRD